jgi:4-hydroxybenzoate polyprenyltransferase
MNAKDFVKLLRVPQYYKNILVFFAPVLALQLFNLKAMLLAAYAFIALCLLSSSIYIINDIKDKEKDKKHGEKRFRPIASGRISILTASLIAVILFILGVVISINLHPYFIFLASLFFLNSILYTFYLKNILIVDIESVSLNYVIRAIAGGIVINAYISPWFLLFIFALALFLTISKRRADMNLLKAKNNYLGYNKTFLDFAIIILLSVLMVSYILYTFMVHTDYLMMFTILPAVFLILRYLYFISIDHRIVRRTEFFLFDKQFLIGLVVWFLLTVAILYLSK